MKESNWNWKIPPQSRNRIFSVFASLLIVVLAVILFDSRNSGSISDQAAVSEQPAPAESLSIAAIYSGTITRNSNLYAELLNWRVPGTLVAELTTRFSRLFDLRTSRPGDSFKLFMGSGDTIMAFEYLTSDWKRFRLDREGSDYVETVDAVGLDRKIERVEGMIRTSLWDALLPLLPDMEIFSDLSDIFGWEIDFLTEPRVGDSFRLVFEVFEKDGRFVKPGKILAAEYILGQTPHRAFLFEDADGHKNYYDENGYSLRKTLLRSPLNYRRISSKFSTRRLHPIYRYYRPHLGVDYAAAAGTPVVAAGDGSVGFKGWRQGFGNYIEIKHPNGMVTCYGHLQGYAKGLSIGKRVIQGQVIGFVGSTGESTGPHLDYRVEKNGRFVDPLKMIVPASMPVKDEYKLEYQQVVAKYRPMLEHPLPETILAQRD